MRDLLDSLLELFGSGTVGGPASGGCANCEVCGAGPCVYGYGETDNHVPLMIPQSVVTMLMVGYDYEGNLVRVNTTIETFLVQDDFGTFQAQLIRSTSTVLMTAKFIRDMRRAVTELKDAQRELADAQRRVERAEAAVESVAASAFQRAHPVDSGMRRTNSQTLKPRSRDVSDGSATGEFPFGRRRSVPYELVTG